MKTGFQQFHTGGGGNCVFFSTAKQLSDATHDAIRDKLHNTGKEQLHEKAQEMIEKQFSAGGLVNVLVNPELRDYDFTGPGAGEQIVNKLLNSPKTDMSNMLCMRLLMEMSFPGKGYLGKDRTNNGSASIYTPITGTYPEDVMGLLSGLAPGEPVPSILSVAYMGKMGDGRSVYDAKTCRLDSSGKVQTKIGRLDAPSDDDVKNFLKANGDDGKNLLGLRGEGKHCKAYVNQDIKHDPSQPNACSKLKEVHSESRTYSAFSIVKNFLPTVVHSIGSAISRWMRPAPPSSQQPVEEVVEKDSRKKDGLKKDGPENEKNKSLSNEMKNDGIKIVDDGFNLVDDDFDRVDNGTKLVDDGFSLVDDDFDRVDDGIKIVDDGFNLVDNDFALPDALKVKPRQPEHGNGQQINANTWQLETESKSSPSKGKGSFSSGQQPIGNQVKQKSEKGPGLTNN
ncbi:MAG: hypothetical protein FWB91_03190 [Defluviitaleaceae bacterium]|nr:hypothetical protein [Defluviitaleaceae bacterium]